MAARKTPLTFEEYWTIFDLIRGDVEAAIKSHHAYMTVNRLAANDRKVQDKINRFPEFWQLNAYALQTTFFIAFGRLFDGRKDTHSIVKLVDETIANSQLFSKTSLRTRKRLSIVHGPDPDWLQPFVNAAWEPTGADLASLSAELATHRQTFNAIYKPIRDSFFAHRRKESDANMFARFQKTNIQEAEDILRFLHTLVWAIRELALNGKRPDLTDSSDYDEYVKRLKSQTETFIGQLS